MEDKNRFNDLNEEFDFEDIDLDDIDIDDIEDIDMEFDSEFEDLWNDEDEDEDEEELCLEGMEDLDNDFEEENINDRVYIDNKNEEKISELESKIELIDKKLNEVETDKEMMLWLKKKEEYEKEILKLKSQNNFNNTLSVANEYTKKGIEVSKPQIKKVNNVLFAFNTTNSKKMIKDYNSSSKLINRIEKRINIKEKYEGELENHLNQSQNYLDKVNYARNDKERIKFNSLHKKEERIIQSKNRFIDDVVSDIADISAKPKIFKFERTDVLDWLKFSIQIPIGYHLIIFLLSFLVSSFFFGTNSGVIGSLFVSLLIFIIVCYGIANLFYSKLGKQMFEDGELELTMTYLKLAPILNFAREFRKDKTNFEQTLRSIANIEGVVVNKIDYGETSGEMLREDIFGLETASGGNGFFDDELEFDDFGDFGDSEVNEGDTSNPRYEEWITFFEQKYNKKRNSEEWSNFDVRVPRFVEVEENPNLEIHIIPQLNFNKKMLEGQVAVLERLFKMKVMRIYDNYNNNKELAIEFATNLVIPPYNYTEVELTKDDTFEIGKTLKGERVKVGIDDVVHINIGGGTGSGKTVAMFNLVNQILYKGDMIAFIDCKNGVSFAPCKDKGYTVITNNEIEELKDFVKLLLEEMKSRNKLFISVNASNLERYKKKCEKDSSLPKIPRLYIFFDELNFLSEIKTDTNKEILTDLQLVWSQGRSAGIHMIDALQKPLAKFFGDTGKSNHFLQYFGIKVFEKAIEDELGKEYIEKVAELPRAKKDRGHFYAKTEEDVFYFRSPYIDESDYIENVMVENRYKNYVLGECRFEEDIVIEEIKTPTYVDIDESNGDVTPKRKGSLFRNFDNVEDFGVEEE